MSEHVLWQGIDEPSMEYLVLRRRDYSLHAQGRIIGLWEGEPYEAAYAIECGLLGEVSRVSWDTGALVAEAPGDWRDHDGKPRPEFRDCRTVDIRQTPFTNTLAILYAELGTGMSLEMPVIHINIITGEAVVAHQHYTCLTWTPERSRYRFRQEDYTVEFDVDRNALVLDYPGLFNRIYPTRDQLSKRRA